jgi:hypothetical protein
VATKQLREEKAPSSPSLQPKVQLANDRVRDDQSRQGRIASSPRPLPEASPPARQSVAVPSLTAHSVTAAGKSESPGASSRPARQGPGLEKKTEGPRLSIGRLEIQIIQENAPAVIASRDAGREGSQDAWEQMDRQHVGRPGGA